MKYQFYTPNPIQNEACLIHTLHRPLAVMRHVPPGRDSNIAVNGCSGFATSTQKGPFTAMLISRSRGTSPIFADVLYGWTPSSLAILPSMPDGA